MARRVKEKDIVLFLSDVMRGEIVPSANEMKAAELLAKLLGMFGESDCALPAPVIVDDVRKGE